MANNSHYKPIAESAEVESSKKREVRQKQVKVM